MKNSIRFNILLLLMVLMNSCANKEEHVIKVEEVSPWCIVNFDSLERTPAERIAMLKEFGFKKYGYNWENWHLDEMKEEFRLARENNIEITSIFLWLNAKRDSLGKLSPANQKMLNNLKESENKPTIWVSFSDNFFKDLDQQQSLALAFEWTEFIKTKADDAGCELALYNHHGWFGNPYNQVAIIEELEEDSLTMAYNFHHAHPYLDEFPEIVKKIKPYLSYVNINGMKKEGPQILTLGEGDYEFEMVKILLDEGFNGPWGILGHIKTEDVHEVLKRNIAGLNELNLNLKK